VLLAGFICMFVCTSDPTGQAVLDAHLKYW
jgi:hypothetical protein